MTDQQDRPGTDGLDYKKCLEIIYSVDPERYKPMLETFLPILEKLDEANRGRPSRERSSDWYRLLGHNTCNIFLMFQDRMAREVTGSGGNSRHPFTDLGPQWDSLWSALDGRLAERKVMDQADEDALKECWRAGQQYEEEVSDAIDPAAVSELAGTLTSYLQDNLRPFPQETQGKLDRLWPALTQYSLREPSADDQPPSVSTYSVM